MSRYKGFIFGIAIIEIVLVLLFNIIIVHENGNTSDKLHRVEIKRLSEELSDMQPTPDELAEYDLSGYKTIVGVREFIANEICNNEYAVEEINGRLYRIEYRLDKSYEFLIYADVFFVAMIILTGAALFYVYKKILKPFNDVTSLPYELAKGNLAKPVKEEKSKLFGRFLWGMDMLREKLEDDRKKELDMHREKKTLIFSLSHDIKTPLSSIEMYSKALQENLYDTEKKRNEALCGITRNAKEIKKYVDEIAAASREDFLDLEVKQDICYLSEIIRGIYDYYKNKMTILHADFKVEQIPECMIKADKNRLIEVFQNIIENALKYGDGKYIHIYGEDEEDCRLIHVENSGNSLKEDELPNLFDSFYRGSNSHGMTGNGLGLYICKNLMRKMDGDVFVQLMDGNFRASVVIRKA